MIKINKLVMDTYGCIKLYFWTPKFGERGLRVHLHLYVIISSSEWDGAA